ncbi:MAG: hypothetical protein LBU11_00025 [Zoogloeaceae bacterium]|jgi:hypothetical protein|nr:hypothetical protein [Zoogloeaceae bacterium]
MKQLSFWSEKMASKQTFHALSPILQIAREILSETKKEMHINDIAEKAIQMNNNAGLSHDDFAKKLSAALSANVKTKTPSFAKVRNKSGGYRKGIYRVRQSRTAIIMPPEPPIEPVGSNFTGKAGEHAVMAELLYRGFNASLMAVDEGVDIVATKNNKYFHIQVKTALSGTNGKYTFNIKNTAFEANNGGETYYILVMRVNKGNIFAILPSSQIAIYVASGIIGGDKSISIPVTPDERFKTFSMKNMSIDQFINNFGLIR